MRHIVVLASAILLFSSLSPPAYARAGDPNDVAKSQVNTDASVTNGRTVPPFVKISVKLPTCELILSCETKRDKPAPLFVTPSKTLTVWLKVKIAF